MDKLVLVSSIFTKWHMFLTKIYYSWFMTTYMHKVNMQNGVTKSKT